MSPAESTDSDRTLPLVEGCCSPAVAFDPIVAVHRQIMATAIAQKDWASDSPALPMDPVVGVDELMPGRWGRRADE